MGGRENTMLLAVPNHGEGIKIINKQAKKILATS